MVEVTKVFQSLINLETFEDELKAVYAEYVLSATSVRVVNVEPENEAAVSAALDTIITAHDPQALTTKQQESATDTSERATLLQQAATALTQIESDKTALTAAASLAAVKPIVQNMLNREERIIKALRAIIRSGLDDS